MGLWHIVTSQSSQVPTISLLKEGDFLVGCWPSAWGGWAALWAGAVQTWLVTALGTLQGGHSQVCFQKLPPAPNKAPSSLVPSRALSFDKEAGR